MKKRENSLLVWTGAAALAALAGLLSIGSALAEGEAAVEAPTADAAVTAEPVAAAEEAPVEEAAAEAAPAEAAAAPVKPRPAEIMPLAMKGLLLDVTNTGKHLIAVGDRGVVLVSNNGKDWAQVATPVRSALTAVSFADDQNGWAVGHDAVILKTADGGKTWAMQNFQPELEKAFLDVLALDASTAFAVGAYGLFFKTVDGGTTWGPAEAAAITTDELHLNAISKLADGSLMVVGEQGNIGISADAGATWTKIVSPYEGSLYGALPLGSGGALIYGLRGNAFTAVDVKAAEWLPVATNTVKSFFGGASLPDGGVALVGLAGLVMKLDASGTTKEIKVIVQETGSSGKLADKEVTGTFSATTPWAGGVLVVGELGVQSLKLN